MGNRTIKILTAGAVGFAGASMILGGGPIAIVAFTSSGVLLLILRRDYPS